jgi:hypothetical protein
MRAALPQGPQIFPAQDFVTFAEIRGGGPWTESSRFVLCSPFENDRRVLIASFLVLGSYSYDPRDEAVTMKIFWSWQSDTPEQIGKYLVRDALRVAINRLKQAENIDEPTRDDLHLDQDTQGTTGSPDLVPTIFGKIEKSEVVIADVTIVGKTNEAKSLINSNVAIELGYALHACTDSRVLLVFNKHYGSYEDLPFDLRHKGGAVVFDLAPEADRNQIAAVRTSLADDFVRKLKPFLQLPPRQSQQEQEASKAKERVRRQEVKKQLATFLQQGQPIQNGIHYSNTTSLHEKADWERRVTEYLSQNLDDSYAVRFRNPSHQVISYPIGINVQMMGPWGELKARMMTLTDLISELRDNT